MGADNWAICPNCKKKIENARAKLIEKANKSYGKVNPEEYLAMLRRAEKEEEIERTLREDYELGISEDGQFYVNYRSSCKVCGFHYDYKIEKDVL